MCKRIILFVMLSMTAVGGSALAGDQLVAYWPFGESGLKDISGNGHDLVAGSEVTIGDFVTFNGTQAGNPNSYLKTESTLDLRGLPSMTIDFWIRTPEKKGWDQQIIELSDNYNSHPGAIMFWYVAASDVFQSAEKTTSSYAIVQTPSSPFGSALQEWHHVALVYPRGQYADFKLYIDGVDRTNAYQGYGDTSYLDLANDTLFLGGRGGNGKFVGSLDKLRIIGNALDAAGVAELFAEERGFPEFAVGAVNIEGGASAPAREFPRLLGVSKDASVAFSLTAPSQRDGASWELMTNAVGTTEWLPWKSGAGFAGTFRHPGVATKISWGVDLPADGILFSTCCNPCGVGAVRFMGAVAMGETVTDEGGVSLSLEYRSPLGGLMAVDFGVLTQDGVVAATLTGLKLAVEYEARLVARKAGAVVGRSKSLRFTLTSRLPQVASWPFGAAGLADVSGNGYDLTVGESTGHSELTADGFLRIRGTSSGSSAAFVKSNRALSLSGADALTVDVWVKYESASSLGWTHQLFDSSSDYLPSGAITLYYNKNDSGNWTFQQGEKVGSEYMVVQSSAYPLSGTEGEWHHLTAIYPKGPYANTKLYIDGVEDSHSYRSNTDSSTAATAFANGVFYLGGRGGAAKFDGEMDDVSIVAGVKTAHEIYVDHVRQKAERTGLPVIGEMVVEVDASNCLPDGFLPAPGANFGFKPGDAVSASAPERLLTLRGKEGARMVMKWELSTNVVGTAEWVQWQSGKGNTVDFTYPDSAVRLRWKRSGGPMVVIYGN